MSVSIDIPQILKKFIKKGGRGKKGENPWPKSKFLQ
jgi:hypothetical protein